MVNPNPCFHDHVDNARGIEFSMRGGVFFFERYHIREKFFHTDNAGGIRVYMRGVPFNIGVVPTPRKFSIWFF